MHGFTFPRAIVALALALALVAPLSALADEDRGLPELVEEFALAPNAYVQEAGEVQFGAGFEREWNDETESEYEAEVEYGITDSLQVGVEGEGSADEGMEAASLGLGWRAWYSHDRQLALTLAGIREEEEEDDDDDSRWWGEPGIVYGQRVGDAQLHAHVGMAFSEGERVALYDLAMLYPVASGLVASLELNGVREDEERLHYLTPGMRFQPGRLEEVEVGLGVPVGLESDAADYGLVLQLIVSLDR